MSHTVPSDVPSTGAWAIDSVHSSVTFTVRHMKVATFRGHFNDVTGELVDGVLSGQVQTDAIDLGTVAMFKEHLMAEDWFDVANHPTLSFKSTDLHAHDGELHAAGELTIKSITKPVDIAGEVRGPLEVPVGEGKTQQRLGLDLSTTINRRDFGIVGAGGADDAVTVNVSLELTVA